MIMRSNSCPKCQGSMAEGFTLVVTDGGSRIVNWVEGAATHGWFGLKLGKKTKHEVQTWRCGRCGFLESYAK